MNIKFNKLIIIKVYFIIIFIKLFTIKEEFTKNKKFYVNKTIYKKMIINFLIQKLKAIINNN